VDPWWLGGRVASHIYLVGKIHVSDNELGSIKGELSAEAKPSNSRWPGGRVASHIYLVGKIYELSAKRSISFAFHFAILCMATAATLAAPSQNLLAPPTGDRGGAFDMTKLLFAVVVHSYWLYSGARGFRPQAVFVSINRT
jgi:hypothetical protein